MVSRGRDSTQVTEEVQGGSFRGKDRASVTANEHGLESGFHALTVSGEDRDLNVRVSIPKGLDGEGYSSEGPRSSNHQRSRGRRARVYRCLGGNIARIAEVLAKGSI
jgi:hypothetical protein